MDLVTLADIEAAARRVAGTAVRTPLLPCPWAPRSPLWLKPENLQPIGAFKIRGAYNAIARLTDEQRALGVVAYSSGNHAQAVAYAAREFGVRAWIVVPKDTPVVKIEATRSHGAEVVLSEVGQREAKAAEIQAETGAALIPPFDHPDVIAGQGTIGLEIADDLDADVVLVPVSGGGLISGVATAIKHRSPKTQVWAVEPELAADTAASLAAGHLVDWSVADRNRTIADGLRSQPSPLTFAHQQAYVDGIVTVSEDEIRAAVALLAHKANLVAEPSGAVTVAGYLNRDLPEGKTVAVISGGNIDPEMLRQIL